MMMTPRRAFPDASLFEPPAVPADGWQRGLLADALASVSKSDAPEADAPRPLADAPSIRDGGPRAAGRGADRGVVEGLLRVLTTVRYPLLAVDTAGRPLRVPRTRAPAPWEDADSPFVPSVIGDMAFVEVLPSLVGDPAALVARMATTACRDLWLRPEGQAAALLGFDRYARAHAHQGARKLLHAVDVLVHADQIADEQAARGAPLRRRWRELLEMAAFLHDVGYVQGGQKHPRRGANDVLFHLGHTASGEALLSDDDRERVAALIAIHGTALPWSDVDVRLVGDHYVDVLVVEEVAGTAEALTSFVRGELHARPRKDNSPALSWLDDADERSMLLRAGWMLHCADNKNGPRSSSPEPYAQRTPVDSVAALDSYLHESERAA